MIWNKNIKIEIETKFSQNWIYFHHFLLKKVLFSLTGWEHERARKIILLASIMLNVLNQQNKINISKKSFFIRNTIENKYMYYCSIENCFSLHFSIISFTWKNVKPNESWFSFKISQWKMNRIHAVCIYMRYVLVNE